MELSISFGAYSIVQLSQLTTLAMYNIHNIKDLKNKFRIPNRK
jgi:hypothetical protein